jgi:hypothetical protein
MSRGEEEEIAEEYE